MSIFRRAGAKQAAAYADMGLLAPMQKREQLYESPISDFSSTFSADDDDVSRDGPLPAMPPELLAKLQQTPPPDPHAIFTISTAAKNDTFDRLRDTPPPLPTISPMSPFDISPPSSTSPHNNQSSMSFTGDSAVQSALKKTKPLPIVYGHHVRKASSTESLKSKQQMVGLGFMVNGSQPYTVVSPERSPLDDGLPKSLPSKSSKWPKHLSSRIAHSKSREGAVATNRPDRHSFSFDRTPPMPATQRKRFSSSSSEAITGIHKDDAISSLDKLAHIPTASPQSQAILETIAKPSPQSSGVAIKRSQGIDAELGESSMVTDDPWDLRGTFAHSRRLPRHIRSSRQIGTRNSAGHPSQSMDEESSDDTASEISEVDSDLGDMVTANEGSEPPSPLAKKLADMKTPTGRINASTSTFRHSPTAQRLLSPQSDQISPAATIKASDVPTIQQKSPLRPKGGDIKLITSPQMPQTEDTPNLVQGSPYVTDADLAADFGSGNVESRSFVIAVLGAPKTGKSDVISRGIQKPSNPAIIMQNQTSEKATISRSVFAYEQNGRCTVDLLEIDAGLIAYDPVEGIQWPRELPSMDGALICFNIADGQTFQTAKDLMSGIWTRNPDLPMILCGCEPDPLAYPVVNRSTASRAGQLYEVGFVELDMPFDNATLKMKHSFAWVLNQILSQNGITQQQSKSGLRRSLAYSTNSGSSGLGYSVSMLHSPLTTTCSNSSDQPDSGVADLSPEIPTSFFPSPDKDLNSSITTRSSTDTTLYYSRETLIDKWLYSIVADDDDEYVAAFIIVYRRFATPFEVLKRMMDRYQIVAGRLKTDPVLSRLAHTKLCAALLRWIEIYPGDLASHACVSLLHPFVHHMSNNSWTSHYSIRLGPILQLLPRVRDPDQCWATSESIIPYQQQHNINASISSCQTSSSLDSEQAHSSTALLEVPPSDVGAQGTISAAQAKVLMRDRSASIATTGSNTTFGSTGSLKGGKSQYATLVEASNAVLNVPPADLATQISRKAWEAFAEMRPRDLLRYVIASKKTINDGSENPVSKAIAFVNYISDWSASMIMVQSRLRTRAKVVEHMIEVAIHLREMDNFDSLMAVLSALNSQPVFRLNQTLDVIREKPVFKKRFESLNRLMSTSKNFQAYRMALSASSPQMIPYLGCHLSDITRLHDGKDDLRDDEVNWTKMRMLAGCASAVKDCSTRTPALHRDPPIEQMIFGLPVLSLDDDAIYDLSYRYKPAKSSGRSTKLKSLVYQM